MKQIVVIGHNIRSCYNVGALLRTADAMAVDSVYLTGYTPYPIQPGDTRMPHIAEKLQHQIHKTALGAEESVNWAYEEAVSEVIARLHSQQYLIAALEQVAGSQDLSTFKPPERIALILGREVEGIEKNVLDQADCFIEIPMLGTKESLNVIQAAAIALYHFRYC
jgi:23S rRNA (guanosine2251-2'-O)-methyltransferase